MMSWLNNLKVRSKALLLVGMALLTAATMAGVTALGLSSLKTSLDQATLSTNVERYAFRTILQEKAYLFNANAATHNSALALQAFQEAEKDVSVINETLDKIGEFDNLELSNRADAARKGTAQYASLYRQGVDALQTQQKETEALEKEGETATQQAKNYIKTIDDPQKKGIAQNILEYTYLIRANEKRYMLYQKPEMFEAMKNEFAQMMELLDTLAQGSTTDGLPPWGDPFGMLVHARSAGHRRC